MPYANPYSTGAAFPDMSPQILKLFEMKMSADQHNEDRILRQRALDNEGRRLQLEYGDIPGNAIII